MVNLSSYPINGFCTLRLFCSNWWIAMVHRRWKCWQMLKKKHTITLMGHGSVKMKFRNGEFQLQHRPIFRHSRYLYSTCNKMLKCWRVIRHRFRFKYFNSSILQSTKPPLLQQKSNVPLRAYFSNRLKVHIF